jgi:hypothetical protein
MRFLGKKSRDAAKTTVFFPFTKGKKGREELFSKRFQKKNSPSGDKGNFPLVKVKGVDVKGHLEDRGVKDRKMQKDSAYYPY